MNQPYIEQYTAKECGTKLFMVALNVSLVSLLLKINHKNAKIFKT